MPLTAPGFRADALNLTRYGRCVTFLASAAADKATSGLHFSICSISCASSSQATLIPRLDAVHLGSNMRRLQLALLGLQLLLLACGLALFGLVDVQAR